MIKQIVLNPQNLHTFITFCLFCEIPINSINAGVKKSLVRVAGTS